MLKVSSRINQIRDANVPAVCSRASSQVTVIDEGAACLEGILISTISEEFGHGDTFGRA
jgi:hypothetical protein